MNDLNGGLTKEALDAISEVSSIAMGAAGSTLGILVGQEIEIAPPQISEYENLAGMDIPFGDAPKTIIMVQFVKGIFTTALYIVKNSDVRKLAGMMLGSTEEGSDEELTELQLGAVGELMSQMMNSAATGMASVLHETVEINNPEVIPYSSDMLAQCLPKVLSEPFVLTNLQMKANQETVLEMMELRVSSELKEQVALFMSIEAAQGGPEMAAPEMATRDMEASAQINAHAEPQPAMAGTAMPHARAAVGSGVHVDPVTVRPVEFGSFDHQPNVYGEENKNLSLVMDVTLNLTVELGRTELPIKDVLELTRGSVIELDRIAGEPVDLMANGKLIAKGEVVVIEDNFGLRITSIISPAERLRGL
ncbi:flagellar motor switch phosphatase FliY [Vampirovibrio chlorellavorus]|uniref:flagellar motor switch phosphatase FliY n=1 Tax=Vampirovibrio chlorellavorus TaxID=758823 RepID=UPI0026F33095|nr:flagellar motor switch phosphatase FliY [Vampirovibrio chlorellavorus]